MPAAPAPSDDVRRRRPPVAPRQAARAPWIVGALVLVVLALSSVAPFVRVGRGMPRVGAGDALAAALYVLTWAPFVAALLLHAARARRRGSGVGAWVGYAGLLVASPVLHTLLFAWVQTLVAGGRGPGGPAFGGPVFQVLTMLGGLQYLVVLAVVEALHAARDADRSRLEAAELALERQRLEAQLTRARLDALRAQLQPHFLFNTLNSVSVLAAQDPAGAQSMIRRLSELLRAVLADEAGQTVPLQRELELLASYVAIQQVRFGDRLTVTTDVDDLALACAVPTLVLQPLVENAIHHAVARHEDGGSVRVRAQLRDGRVHVVVADDGPAGSAASDDGGRPDGGFGVGLRNTAARLEALYGGGHALWMTRSETGGCAVHLELPVHPRRAGAGA